MSESKNAKEFAQLVKKMRDAQKIYFCTGSRGDFRKAKKLEREVDEKLREIFDKQERLL